MMSETVHFGWRVHLDPEVITDPICSDAERGPLDRVTTHLSEVNCRTCTDIIGATLYETHCVRTGKQTRALERALRRLYRDAGDE